MLRPIAAVIALALGSVQVLSAQGFGSLTGSVRDTSGVPLAGAEIILATKRAITTPQGSFRLDSVPVGDHLITIRLVGFVALRSTVSVRRDISSYSYILRPAAQLLPTVYTEVSRQGIYGTVGDTALKSLAGVKVQIAGRHGGEAITDSTGHFAFPAAVEGQYLLRAFLPGYEEERLFLELGKREGVEVAMRLRSTRELLSRADELAVRDLGRRLEVNLPQDRLSGGYLQRYGSLSLCEVNSVASKVRVPPDSLTIILNGTFILTKRSVRDLCSWRADEVELVEFGENVCRDATRSLVDLLNIWCSNFTGKERGPRGKPIRTQPRGVPFVVIWEKK